MTSTDQVSTDEQPTGTITSAETTLFLPRAPPHPPPPQRQHPSEPPSKVARYGILEGTDQHANWLLGVEPQDVRFPVNIAQLAFTANYFAALTSDRCRIYINRRVPGWRSNCKRRAIEFDAEQRPSSIVSFDHRDTLCVVFRRRIEFFSLATLAMVGEYDSLTAEVVAAGARCGRSPLGALWCDPAAATSAAAPVGAPDAATRSDALLTPPATSAAFTVWTGRTDAPQRALLLGPSVVGRPERFLCFYWTSPETVLLVSRNVEPQLLHHNSQEPLIFCAYDTTGRRPMQRLCRRSVLLARQFCLSPDGRLLLLSGGSRHQLLEATTLRQLLVLPRRQAAEPVSAPLPMAVTNCGDLLLLQAVGSAALGPACLEIHRRGGGLSQPARFNLAGLLGCPAGSGGGGGRGAGDCRVYAVGELGALLVFEQDGGGGGSAGMPEGDHRLGPLVGQQPPQSQQPQPQPQQPQQSRSWVALVDLNGNVIMRAQWPRSHVHLVSDDLLVYLKRLSMKPFSAAHACVFDFNSAVPRRSHWAESADPPVAASKPPPSLAAFDGPEEQV